MPLEVNALTFIRIALVCLLLAACEYRTRNFNGADDGDSAGPRAPVAVIRSATADGRLVLPESGNATLDGSGSSDPDGDALTYAWVFDASCGVPSTGEVLSQPALTVDAASLSSGCGVTLTVTDTTGLSGSVTVTVEHRSIGGYVARISGCRETYDDTLTEAQGTPERPFCAFGPVIDALERNAIADVFVAADVYEQSATLVLPPASYHGGYDPQTWTQDFARRARVRGNLGGAADPVLRLSSGGATSLQAISVQRDTPCTASACSSVEITGTDVAVDRFSVLAPFDTSSGPSPGRDVGISVGLSSAGGASLTGSALDVTVGGAESSVGILATGPVTVRVEGATLTMPGSGSFVVGVWTLSGAVLDLTDATIVLNGAPGAGFGVLAGRSDVLGVDGCAGTNVVCDASGTVRLDGGSIVVAASTSAAGVAAAGASTVELLGTQITASAWRATGVHTLGVGVVLHDDVQSIARFVDSTQAERASVIAYRDGTVNRDGASVLGAGIVTVNGGYYSAQTPNPTMAVLASAVGMELDGTQGGRITGSAHIEVEGTDAGSVQADVVYAVATRETRQIELNANRFEISKTIIALKDIAAFADGDASTIGRGSRNLSLIGNLYDALLVGAVDGTHRSCVALTTSNGTVMSGANVLDCASEMFSVQTDTTFSVGLWTQNTVGTVVTGASVSMTRLAGVPPVNHATMWLIGILDGVIPDKTGIEPSNGLVIDRSSVYIPALDTAKALGVYLRGFKASYTKPVLTNGHIDVTAIDQAIGVAVERRGAVIAHNTITYGQCLTSGCPGTGVGLQLLTTNNHGVVVRANNFTVGGRANPALSPAILDSGGTSAVGLNTLVFNVWGGFSGGSGQSHELYRAQTTAPVPPAKPAVGDMTRTEGSLATSLTARDNVPGATLFCTTRPGYLAIQSPGRNVSTESLTADAEVGARLELDFDGVARQSSPYDIGADERTCSNL